MKRLFLALLGSLFGLGAAACLPISAPLAPLPTDTPQPPTQTPTATIVWFPPTPTTTPLPTTTLPLTPTLDTRPSFGALQFEDQFSGESLWATGRTGSGTITQGQGELTLAVNRPGGYLTSQRSGVRLENFYAEITASPTICRGGDEYGLLLRTSPSGDFYRFSLTCDGQTRLDKFYQGKASSPQPLTMSGAVPRGAPSVSRLAVLANGNELLFYVNGEYLFSVRDPSLITGGLGVFARSAGDTQVTVNFSDLKVYQTNE